jgi:hypothetical protein
VDASKSKDVAVMVWEERRREEKGREVKRARAVDASIRWGGSQMEWSVCWLRDVGAVMKRGRSNGIL